MQGQREKQGRSDPGQPPRDVSGGSHPCGAREGHTATWHTHPSLALLTLSSCSSPHHHGTPQHAPVAVSAQFSTAIVPAHAQRSTLCSFLCTVSAHHSTRIYLQPSPPFPHLHHFCCNRRQTIATPVPTPTPPSAPHSTGIYPPLLLQPPPHLPPSAPHHNHHHPPRPP